MDDLRLTVRRALEQLRLTRENIALRQSLAEDKLIDRRTLYRMLERFVEKAAENT